MIKLRRHEFVVVVVAGLMGCGHRTKSREGSKPTLDPSKAQAAGAPYLNSGIEMSLPFPTKVDQRKTYSLFFYPAHLLAAEVGEPNFLISVDAIDGSVIEERPITLSGLGLDLPLVDPRLRMPLYGKRQGIGIANAEWPGLLNALFEKERLLAEAYWNEAPASAQLAKPAAEVLDAWPKMSEAGFMPVYLALGAGWFRWLREGAGKGG